MSNPFSQRVNRQLLLAQQQLDVQVDIDSASGRLRQTGIFEAALFHLYRAYLEMLRELADNYQLDKPESLDTLSALSQALKQVGKTPAEVQELTELEARGFVAEILSAWKSLFQGPQAPGEVKMQRPEGLISTRQIAETELDREKLSSWIGRLREVSDRHREIMVEY